MLESIALIIMFGIFFGKISELIKLPSLVGMIIAGIILGPHGFNLLDPMTLKMSTEIREIALVIILTRAGLSLDVFELFKVGRPVLLMSFVPAVFEVIGIVILGPIFFNLTILEAALIGCIIAAVSPAVVVPRMIHLINHQYGTKHSVPQIVLSGSSVDDVFVIVFFTAILGLIQKHEISFLAFLKIPSSIILGIALGYLMAKFAIFIFKKIKLRDTVKVMFLLSLSLASLRFEEAVSDYVSISAFIAVMAMGVILKNDFRKTAVNMSMKYNKLWAASEFFLFVLVGVTIDMNDVTSSGLQVVIIILLALIFRSLGVFVSLIKTRLTLKEKIYCAIAYIPKATVQAVMGGVPLAAGLSIGKISLTFAALSILVTAPLGAYLMDISYKKLLKKDDVFDKVLKKE